jgi:hypothetical protein
MLIAAMLLSTVISGHIVALRPAGRSCADGAQCRTGSCVWPDRKPLTPKRTRGICAAESLPKNGLCGRFIVRGGRIVVPACR